MYPEGEIRKKSSKSKFAIFIIFDSDYKSYQSCPIWTPICPSYEILDTVSWAPGSCDSWPVSCVTVAHTTDLVAVHTRSYFSGGSRTPG